MKTVRAISSSALTPRSKQSVRQHLRVHVGRAQAPAQPLHSENVVITFPSVFGRSNGGALTSLERLRELIEHRFDWADEEDGEVPTTDRAIRAARALLRVLPRTAKVGIFPTTSGGIRFQVSRDNEIRAVEVSAEADLTVVVAEEPSWVDRRWKAGSVVAAALFLTPMLRAA